MGRVVIACCRPKDGKHAALDALAVEHFATLYNQGLVTRRAPVFMRARDGTLLEVFEWKSQRAIEDAHHDPVVLEMWAAYAQVCEHVPVGRLQEASEFFSGFQAVPFKARVPDVSRIYNHVQVDGRISTSGLLSAESLQWIADAGYRRIINLLPSDNPHALSGEAELLAELGIAYDHIPVDFSAPSDDDLASFMRAMQAGAGDKVWVHCAANFRVTAFTAVYGQQQLGWSAERAAELIAEVWEPDVTWQRFLDAAAKARV